MTSYRILIAFCIVTISTHAEESHTNTLVKNLLSQNLGTRSFSFPDVIEASTGKKVHPYNDQDSSHRSTITAISQAADATRAELSQQDSPIRKLRRINEASRYFEDSLLTKINAHPELSCSIPLNSAQNAQRYGYPDLLITHTDIDGHQTYFYLDPKLYEETSKASSLRTFYYEPRTTTNKIQHDATHLLIGFSHDGNEGAWIFTSWEIVDLATIKIRLKAEFQTSNRELYRDKNMIRASSADEVVK